ncbi:MULTISPECIES: hypothetical protein [Sphingobacterium]|uniref:hypothetical protein n=1 Tax=Sphingobacterium TaxID=28453 RepID=UPI001047C9A7|nr:MULTISPECIES: hypothetical protein [Sphingobacterium]MCW2259795.1 hypothetical protein [Sphingobacterium kitahiroshimense]TCR03365.1 hypothetical protein EDF67_11224 [Sphingobacterium sp. JUb78]
MVEVFITDIQNKTQSERILSTIQNENVELKINLDLNETNFSFPCGHTILRVEGDKINSDKILVSVRKQGFKCEILEDKICKPTEKL